MKMTCPHCSQLIEADDEGAGMKIACPTCKEEFTLLPKLHAIPDANEQADKTPILKGHASNSNNPLKTLVYGFVLVVLLAAITEVGIYANNYRLMNRSLTQSNAALTAENAGLKDGYLVCSNYLQINDTINENKEQLIKQFQSGYSANCQDILKAAGEGGEIFNFQVSDVLFYKGDVVVVMNFLCGNADSSGSVVRVGLCLDPDKDYEAANCVMLEKTMILSQEFTSLTNGSNTNQSWPGTPAQNTSPPPFHMSDETKNALIQDAANVLASVASAIINNAITSGSDNDNQ